MKNFLIGENKCMTEGVTKETFETQFSASDDKINQEINNRKQEIGELSTLSTDEKSNIVSAINEVFEKSRLSLDVTYYVDSDQSLLDWANNVEGNDYSAVFIKKGEWTSNVSVNLTTAGTKVVLGEAGSKLVINGVENALFYDDVPTSSDYWMKDVSVETSYDTSNGYSSNCGFKNCANLTNCSSISNDTSNDDSCGFLNCTNLTNCTGTATGINDCFGFKECNILINCSGTGTVTADEDGLGIGYGLTSGYGFHDCTNLTNCTGTGTGVLEDPGYGFNRCTNLTNCTGTGNGLGEGYGFNGCTSLTNCTGTGTGSYGSCAFHYCTSLTNCNGTGTTTGNSEGSYGYGFQSCTNLTNCTGTGTATGTTNVKGYGFIDCKGVSYCKEGDTPCTTSLFESSYASLVEDERFLCNGTADGGFNGDDLPESFDNSENYTYIVDSDKALLDWANKSGSNDYTYVLIRKGAWTSTVGVNLTTAGTKAVQGEPGSKLIFSGVEKGLFYDTTLTGNDYWIRDVVVEGIEIPSDGFFSSFFQCTNLMNCSGYGKGKLDSNGPGKYVGVGGSFRDCTNLSFCYNLGIAKIAQPEVEEPVEENGESQAESTEPPMNISFNNCTNLVGCVSKDRNTSASGFISCKYLINCVSEDSLSGEHNGMKVITGYGFTSCHNLIGCKSGFELENTSEFQNVRIYAFYACLTLTECVGIGLSSVPIPTGPSNDTYSAFYACHNLTNCKGYGYGVAPTGVGIGYYGCYRLSQCIGLGTGENEGYGFCKCVGVINCDTDPDKNSTTLNFKDCYSAYTTEDRFLCNGSAEGGFNGNDIPEAIKTNSVNYTYVVDSDQALLDWANNKEGNDYSTVLIRKGTWTSNVGVNLTTSGTKVVVGEVGSKLKFNEVEKALFYDELPTENDYWMRNVSVDIINIEFEESSNFRDGCGFHSCTNLTNCTGNINSNENGYGFHSCTNLTNCTGNGTGETDGSGGGLGCGFNSCTSLTNCTGNGTGIGAAYGFQDCTNLTNCTGTSTGIRSAASNSAFQDCTNLTNCTGTGTATYFENMYCTGFESCTNLTNCVGTGSGIGDGNENVSGYGFFFCTNLTNCKGNGIGIALGTGYGFYRCKGVSYCKEGATPSTTSLFENCYSSLVEDERFLCNGTADGGFNGEDVSSYGSVGNIQDLTTTDKSSIVAAINEINNNASSGGGSSGGGSGSDGIVPTFTYEVNSDQALLDWANNVEGNDYSAVLIRRGTWTSTTGVNLTTSETKVVVGEAGSKLVFNEVEKGLFYDTAPTTSDYWMRDVTVECTGIDSGKSYGFYRCTNLTNCTGISAVPGFGTEYGFYECINLTNCTGSGTIFGYGFYKCTNLTNCKGSSYGYGFSKCTNLTNCSGTGYGYEDGDGFGYGFNGCTNLINCIGSGTGTGSAEGYGFEICGNLTNCTGTGTGRGTGSAYGFKTCFNLTNCTGTGTSTSYGYGFDSCKQVSGCKKGGNCTTSVFNNSYASFSENTTYSCSDTPEGGFNDPTN